MVRVALSVMTPTSTMRPSRMPTSARCDAPPVPSTTVPPLSFRSSMSGPLGSRQLQFGRYRMAEELGRVLPRDLAHLVGREVGETDVGARLRVGPRRVRVRVVAFEADV